MADPEASKPAPSNGPPKDAQAATNRRESFSSQNSQTARQFIESQIRLEADAREILPYSFDTCTKALGPLRQSLFACLTCNPAPTDSSDDNASYTPAAVCYSCSIACHGEHNLVELFSKRNFVCDCGTTRMPSTSPCTLRNDPQTGAKGVHSEEPHPGNKYNHNFQNKFCGCNEDYDPNQERGTMFQCLGVGTVETGGCGEDWWHPECLIGLSRDWYQTAKQQEKEKQQDVKAEDAVVAENGDDNKNKQNDEPDDDDDEETPLPPGFPEEGDFDMFICYKCVDSNPWLKRYAGTTGFLPPVFKEGGLAKPVACEAKPAETTDQEPTTAEPIDPTTTTSAQSERTLNSKKRKADDDDVEPQPTAEPSAKRIKDEETSEPTGTNTDTVTAPSNNAASPSTSSQPQPDQPTAPKHTTLPTTPPRQTFSLFLTETFRDHFCRCPDCYPHTLAAHPQLREEEEAYEPPVSEDGDHHHHHGDGARSTGTGSLLDRGEAALSNIDRVRAIEGAMVYNHLRDRVKEFLKPFAESGTAVSAEDIKAYFEKLRGDDQHIREAAAAGQASSGDGGGGGDGKDGDSRREQNGY
ncbi:hypothetical protein BO86DRAFT_390206 [Aspergillus japonicus CBS 114.51]|uniref:UBR-type domain-containing protein n=2 Tax=Aspergillus TaxID=5052 RepID=A0A2V5ISG0_ASPV1|nr:hypothetical protein BO86DRAFT_390206 [Aspergillus japonicus CBS 114.51]PYI22836.1 hypothetical protein BO99DRAFT_352573 [Aspergillus violaceofuscus CBS 115571]RAH80615.1 hypothetical protein BO86DRAFT_390206 [Aspergillus japonicus CBS 114.51]